MKISKKILPIAMLGTLSVPMATFAASCSKNTALKSIYLEFDDNFVDCYATGDKLKMGGIKVFGIYGDGQHKEIELSKCTITPSTAAELKTDDNTVAIDFGGCRVTYPIYVFQSVITKDTDDIKRYEPSEPEKVYTTTEASQLYFKTTNAENQIKEDVIGYISDYAKVADVALIAEQFLKELAPAVQKTITFLIKLLLGENMNFIGKFNSSDIIVRTLSVDSYDDKNNARLSAELALTIDTYYVDRTDESDPRELPYDNNNFKGLATITIRSMPYFLGKWSETGQTRPYFGIGVNKNILKTDSNWSISYDFNGVKKYSGSTTTYQVDTKTWDKDHYFETAEQETQILEFMGFQSYYLDKLKAQ